MIAHILTGVVIAFIYLFIGSVIAGIIEHLDILGNEESFMVMLFWPIAVVILTMVGIWILGRTCAEWVMDKLEGMMK